MSSSAIIKPASSRSYLILPADNGMILDLGPASTSSLVGTFVIQFNPDLNSDYSVIVMGRCWGTAAQEADVPFLPIPYRRVTLNNIAQDYAIVTSSVSGASLIQIPANWSIGLFVSTSSGTCRVVSWNLPGSSTP